MALDFGEKTKTSIFKHSDETDTGRGMERVGQATVIVSLDGTGDTDNINEAIKLLPTTGGVIFVKEGIYEHERVTISKDNVRIEGTGDGTNIKIDSFAALVISANNIKIVDVKIEGVNTNHIGIQISNGKTNILIESIHFLGISASFSNSKALFIDGSMSNSRVLNCFADDMGGNAFFFSGDNNILSNCTVDVAENGIITDGATNSTVQGNTTKNCTAAGIVLSDDNATSDNNTCIGNICSSNQDGIRVFGDCNENIISSNQCTSNSRHGIFIDLAGARVPDKNIIIGNICLNNTTSAITDEGTNTHPNGTSGTTNLTLDDLNIIA